MVSNHGINIITIIIIESKPRKKVGLWKISSTREVGGDFGGNNIWFKYIILNEKFRGREGGGNG